MKKWDYKEEKNVRSLTIFVKSARIVARVLQVAKRLVVTLPLGISNNVMKSERV